VSTSWLLTNFFIFARWRLGVSSLKTKMLRMDWGLFTVQKAKQLSYSIWAKFLLASLPLVFMWISFHNQTRLIDAGFHFADDKHHIEIYLYDQDHTILETLQRYMGEDIQIRLRPVYMFLRVAVTHFYGYDYKKHHILLRFCTILSTVFFCCGLILLRVHPVLATIGTFLTMCGEQGFIFTSLGPGETEAFFFFSIGLLILAAGIRYRIPWLAYLAYAPFVGASLCKEAFIILLPAVILFHAWLESVETGQPLIDLLKAKRLFIAVAAVYVLACLFFIFKYIGTNSIGYAEVSGFPSAEKVWLMTEALLYYSNFYTVIIFLLLPLGIYLVIDFARAKSKQELFSALVVFILVIAIYIPQVYLYKTTGFFDRYCLPALFAAVLLLLVLLEYFRRSRKAYFPVVVALFTPLLYVQLHDTWYVQKNDVMGAYVFDGYHNTQALNDVLACTEPSDPILVVGHVAENNEYIYSVLTYLQANGYTNVRFGPVHLPGLDSPFYQSLEKDFMTSQAARVDTSACNAAHYKAIVVRNERVYTAYKQKVCDSTAFTITSWNHLRVLCRKDSVPAIKQ
jgi:hypothetical protein